MCLKYRNEDALKLSFRGNFPSDRLLVFVVQTHSSTYIEELNPVDDAKAYLYYFVRRFYQCFEQRY